MARVVRAVCDACVLYPAPLRDLLMWLGLSGICQLRWSERIQHEWKHCLLRNRADLCTSQLDRTEALMNQALPDALVSGFDELVAGLTLPDPHDCHVVAAAISCHADVIVTVNMRDFPQDQLSRWRLEARHPDQFLEELFENNRARFLWAARRQRAQLSNPPIPTARFLDILRRQGLPKTAQLLSRAQDKL